jgi:hypothetical protein
MSGTEKMQSSEIAAPLVGELVASTPEWDEALTAPLDPSKLITGALGELEDLGQKVKAAKESAKSALKLADEKAKLTAERGLFTDHKRLAIEGLQEVAKCMSDAVQKLAEASDLSFQMHRRTADAAYTLFQLGTRSIAANQMVYQHLYETLNGASKHKLAELAKQELERVMFQLKYQQDQSQRVIKLEERLAKREGVWLEERESLSRKLQEVLKNVAEQISSQTLDIKKSSAILESNVQAKLQSTFSEIDARFTQHRSEMQGVLSQKCEQIEGRCNVFEQITQQQTVCINNEQKRLARQVLRLKWIASASVVASIVALLWLIRMRIGI